MPRELVRRSPGPSLSAVGEAAATADDLHLCMAAVARKRDRAAFGRLVQHFAPRLIGFLASAGASRAEAEEIALETMVGLWREAALFDSRRVSLDVWVFVLARNLRRERAGAPASAPADAGEAPASGTRLREQMARLPREQAEALRLSFLAGAPDVAFARAFGLPEASGKARLRLAMAKLGALLEGGT
jgi:RNA polymerase sigma-70 factor, ECF subfamily